MKIFFYVILFFYLSIYSAAETLAQQIYPQKLEVLEYCVGTDISMPYKLSGTFNPDNKFNLEISDSSGNFPYPNVKGSIKSVLNDTIKGKLSYLPSSDKYKLRIVSTSPAIISAPMQGNIRIKTIPDYRNIYSENEITAKMLSSTCDTINSLFEFNCYNFKGEASKLKWNTSKIIEFKEVTDSSSKVRINLGNAQLDYVGISFSNECGFSSSAVLTIFRGDFRPNFDTNLYQYQKIDTACEGAENRLNLGGYSLRCYIVTSNWDVVKQYYYSDSPPRTLWKLPQGMKITKNYYPDSSKVDFSVNSKSGIIEVDLRNECGYTARKPLKIEMRVIPKPNPIEQIIGDTLLCSNIKNNFYSIKLDTLVSKYDWKINIPNQIISKSIDGSKVGIKPFQNGTISVTAENKCGKSDTIFKLFKIDSLPLPPVTIPQFSEICDGNIDKPININAVSTSSGISKVKFRWELPNSAMQVRNNSDGSSIGIKLLPATKSAEVKLFSQNYCGESKSSYIHKIKVYSSTQKPKVELSSSDSSICANQKITFLTKVFNKSEFSDYKWSLNNVVVDLNGDSIFNTTNINENTLVKVSVNSLPICDLQSNIIYIALSDSLLITTKPLPINPSSISGNLNICLEDSLQSYEVSNDVDQKYVWRIPNIVDGNSDSSKIILIPIKRGDGPLTVYSKNECGESLPISIDIQIRSCKNLYIPNIFSCNSEMGWNIEGMDNYPKATVKVYNRWGSLVFENTGYESPWDGSVQGSPVSLGTYYYILEFNSMKKKPITGSVTIIK